MSKVSSKSKPRFPWHAAIAVLCLFLLGISVNAYADQYNFYFSKPKKSSKGKQKPDAQVEQQEEENNEETPEEPVEKKTTAAKDVPPPPVETAPVIPPPPATVATEEKKPEMQSHNQTLTIPAGQQAPIIINNTNNVGVAPAPAPVAPAPVAEPVKPTTDVKGPSTNVEANLVLPTKQELEAVAVIPREKRSPWKLATSAAVMFQDFHHNYSSSNYGAGHYYQDFTTRDATYGGMVTLGYEFTKFLGISVYGGARYAPTNDRAYLHAGADLEFLPLRIPIRESWDLLQFGIIAGASTAFAANDNIGTFHGGARLNINFGRHFGVTSSVRANLGYVMVEGGLVTRL